MAGERRAGLLAQAGDEVDRAIGKPDGGAPISRKRTAGQAGVLGGLDHGGVAHRERGRHGAPEHLRRVVPGNDVRGDAEWLAQHRDM